MKFPTYQSTHYHFVRMYFSFIIEVPKIDFVQSVKNIMKESLNILLEEHNPESVLQKPRRTVS